MSEAPPAWAVTLIAEMRGVARRLDQLEARLAPAPPVPADADPVTNIRAQCDRDGIPIAGDSHISEGAAARLLGVSLDTMRRRRYEGRPVVRAVKFLGRYRCALIDVAEKLSTGIEEIDE